jgi:hypothetical protein
LIGAVTAGEKKSSRLDKKGEREKDNSFMFRTYLIAYIYRSRLGKNAVLVVKCMQCRTQSCNEDLN